MRVAVCADEQVPEMAIGAAAGAIAAAYGVEVVQGPRFTLPPEAYNPSRRQWLAAAAIEAIPEVEDADKILGIVSPDLYAPGLNFVFGQAEMCGRRAVISIARLWAGDDPRAQALFLRRVAVEAVHEFGHLLGLRHCHNPRCAMFFSNSLADTDRKGPMLCPICREKAAAAIRAAR